MPLTDITEDIIDSTVAGTGSVVPLSGTLIGGKDPNGNFQPLSITTTGILQITGTVGTVGAGNSVQTVTGSVGISGLSTSSINNSPVLNVDVLNTVSVSIDEFGSGTPIFTEFFEGSALETITRWSVEPGFSGFDATQYSNYELASGSINLYLSAGIDYDEGISLNTYKPFFAAGNGGLDISFRIKHEATPFRSGTVRFWGMTEAISSPTTWPTSWPTIVSGTGIGFNLNGSTSTLSAVVYNFNSTSYSSVLSSKTDGLYHDYGITINQKNIIWYIDNQKVATVNNINVYKQALYPTILSRYYDNATFINLSASTNLYCGHIVISSQKNQTFSTVSSFNNLPGFAADVGINGAISTLSPSHLYATSPALTAGTNSEIYKNWNEKQAYVRGGQVSLSSTTPTIVRNSTWNLNNSISTKSISSTSVQDKSGGSGAKTVRIWYTSGYNDRLLSMDLNLNGTTAVAFTRVDAVNIIHMQVISAASLTATNVGTITAWSNNNGTGTALAVITAGANVTQYAHHITNNNRICYVTGLTISAKGNNVNFWLSMADVSTGCFSPVTGVYRVSSAGSTMQINFSTPIVMPPNTMLVVYAQADSTTAATAYAEISYYEIGIVP